MLTRLISCLRWMARLTSVFSERTPQCLIQLPWKTISLRNPPLDVRKIVSIADGLNIFSLWPHNFLYDKENKLCGFVLYLLLTNLYISIESNRCLLHDNLALLKLSEVHYLSKLELGTPLLAKQWMGVASHPRGAGGSPLFYISTSFTDCTTEYWTLHWCTQLTACHAHSTSSTGAFNLLKFVLLHEEEEEEGAGAAAPGKSPGKSSMVALAHAACHACTMPQAAMPCCCTARSRPVYYGGVLCDVCGNCYSWVSDNMGDDWRVTTNETITLLRYCCTSLFMCCACNISSGSMRK